MFFKSESEILDLVRRFETAEISREDWHHREHLVVASVYIRETNSISAATEKMRTGILKFLRAINVELENENPYHETLTVFWITVIYRHFQVTTRLTLLDSVNSILKNFNDKDFPLKFYSREHLFSERARIGYVEPDLKGSTEPV